ncbi:hypothetical protein [Gracilimonas amylolytica]|uniref:hypothetical protein n=1 Tax=Gracilimonas amylolytica TaxID=1749045 RepID=UPI000CD9F655|nr:hypothetical protein [Gracilimonas amylolytica]
MEGTELNFRQLLIALISEKKAIAKVLKGQEKYDKLLSEISKYDIDDDEPLPKQKDLLKTLGIKRKALIALMREMYDKFCSGISRHGNYPIEEVEILICASNMHEDYWMISPERLGFLPNVGDRITIPFLRNNMSGGGYFKVRDISHEIENQKHIIVISIDDNILDRD